MNRATWILESDVFPDSHTFLRMAIGDAGYRLIDWNDAWWTEGFPRNVGGDHTFFHGSLMNASRINEMSDWTPGSFCNTSAFCCSAWYPTARQWLLHNDWQLLPANKFVETAGTVADRLGCSDRVFVRPDSPLKPFSGRVLDVASVSLAALDHGFYFEDDTIPIVVAPIRNIGNEWRFVVVKSAVMAGSEYDARTRIAVAGHPDGDAWAFAQCVASAIPSPAEVYVLDVCESDGELRLLELNPFGGADLYACDAVSVIQSVSKIASDV